MAFNKATIISSEVTRDAKNEITKIHFVIQIQDNAIAGVKEFDYIIDGGTPNEIKDDLRGGIEKLIKEQTKIMHDQWIQEDQAKVETVSRLNPTEIVNLFGINEITSL